MAYSIDTNGSERYATFDLEDAPDAYASFEAGRKFGKVVLTMS